VAVQPAAELLEDVYYALMEGCDAEDEKSLQAQLDWLNFDYCDFFTQRAIIHQAITDYRQFMEGETGLRYRLAGKLTAAVLAMDPEDRYGMADWYARVADSYRG
jgi:hypothetical protein